MRLVYSRPDQPHQVRCFGLSSTLCPRRSARTCRLQLVASHEPTTCHGLSTKDMTTSQERPTFPVGLFALLPSGRPRMSPAVRPAGDGEAPRPVFAGVSKGLSCNDRAAVQFVNLKEIGRCTTDELMRSWSVQRR